MQSIVYSYSIWIRLVYIWDFGSGYLPNSDPGLCGLLFVFLYFWCQTSFGSLRALDPGWFSGSSMKTKIIKNIHSNFQILLLFEVQNPESFYLPKTWSKTPRVIYRTAAPGCISGFWGASSGGGSCGQIPRAHRQVQGIQIYNILYVQKGLVQYWWYIH